MTNAQRIGEALALAERDPQACIAELAAQLDNACQDAVERLQKMEELQRKRAETAELALRLVADLVFREGGR